MFNQLSRRNFLKTTGAVGAGLLLGPTLHAADANPTDFYEFVNNTGGRWTDEQISFTFGQNNWTTLAQAKSAPAKLGGGGRIGFRLSDGKEKYQDFIEYTHNGSGWYGNTTTVDEFVIPITIEGFDKAGNSQKLGIEESRAALFAAWPKEVPKEFVHLAKGTQSIGSPCRGDFNTGKQYGNYFDKYIDEVWDMFATEKKTPGGWTGKVTGTALSFTPPNGGKAVTCAKKPTTREALLGTGPLGAGPGFCAAINRHVLAEPENWNNPEKYYLAEPANYYAKFFHTHGLKHKAYGFCYDDYAGQASYFEVHNGATKLIVTLGWDKAAKA